MIDKNKTIKERVIRSKCMADMFVWLGFEYKKTDKGYVFERTRGFDMAWEDAHYIRNYCRNYF